MSTHNIGFYEEISKIVSSNTSSWTSLFSRIVGIILYPKYDNIVAQSVMAPIVKFLRKISYIASSIIV